MTEPTEGLERRLLLRLLKAPIPLDSLSNAVARKAVAGLRARGLVRNAWSENPGGRVLVLSERGERIARSILERRLKRRRPVAS